jgi:preprotein translocase subunit SecG
MNMTIFQLLAVSFVMSVTAVLFLICSVVLVLIILIQKGKGGGLGAAFGGGLASGILGSKTGDFLTWVTISLVSVFLILAVVMAKFYKPTISDFGQGQVRQDQPISPRQPPAEDTGAVTGSNVPDINLLDDQNDL